MDKNVLEQQIRNAKKRGNFIEAGRLQAQMKDLEKKGELKDHFDMPPGFEEIFSNFGRQKK